MELRDLYLDPETSDLVIDNGSPRTTSNASTAVIHQMLCHYGKWVGDPSLGSRFYNMDLFQADPVPLVQDEAERALGILVSRGQIKSPVVSVDGIKAGRISVRTSFQDSRTGNAVELRIPTRG